MATVAAPALAAWCWHARRVYIVLEVVKVLALIVLGVALLSG
jgi:hypothetical protein